MLSIRNISKSFRTQKVLDKINLEVPEGTTTVIIGPSGEGKSVFLKHLIGLIKPDSGSIFVDGEDITKLNGKELAEIRKKFGMLFQDAALFDSLSVFENVAFPLREHTELLDDEIEKKVLDMLKVVNLTQAEHKWPSELSGGMRKRVGLARALMLHPKILLFDEPTTGLDPIRRDQIRDLIKDTQNQFKITQIVISHDIPTTLRLADKIAMLHGGKIILEATPEDFINSDNEIVRNFVRMAETGFPKGRKS